MGSCRRRSSRSGHDDEGFTFGELGFASAISLALFAVVCVLMFAYVRVLREPER